MTSRLLQISDMKQCHHLIPVFALPQQNTMHQSVMANTQEINHRRKKVVHLHVMEKVPKGTARVKVATRAQKVVKAKVTTQAAKESLPNMPAPRRHLILGAIVKAKVTITQAAKESPPIMSAPRRHLIPGTLVKAKAKATIIQVAKVNPPIMLVKSQCLTPVMGMENLLIIPGPVVVARENLPSTPERLLA